MSLQVNRFYKIYGTLGTIELNSGVYYVYVSNSRKVIIDGTTYVPDINTSVQASFSVNGIGVVSLSISMTINNVTSAHSVTSTYALYGKYASGGGSSTFYDAIVEDGDLKWFLVMPLVLYQLTGETHLVTKTSKLSYVETLYGTLREETDLINPSILFEYEEYPNFNYVYIESLKRYYFITNVVSVRNNVWRMNCHVDVLYTYDTDIRTQDAFVSRNENTYNEFIVDDRYPLSSVINTEIRSLASFTPSTNLINTDIKDTYGHPFAIHIMNDLTETITSETSSAPTGTDLSSINHQYGDNPALLGYACSYSDYTYLCEKLKQTESLNSYIASVVVFPFNLLLNDCLRDANDDLITRKLRVKDTDIKNSANQDVMCYLLKGESSAYHVIADFTITSSTFYPDAKRKYLAREPYKKYELYVPYCGLIPLKTEDFLDQRIIVYFAVDYTTGDGQMFIYNVDNDRIIHSQGVQLGSKIAISTTNNEEITKQKQANSLNLGVGLISGIASVGIGLASGNAVAVVGGVLSMTKAVASSVNKNAMLIERGNVPINGDRLGLYGERECKLIVTYRSVNTNVTETQYGKLQGYPTNGYMSLSSITGYTEIPEMHYEPSTYKFITTSEIDEIKNLANNGIIL